MGSVLLKCLQLFSVLQNNTQIKEFQLVTYSALLPVKTAVAAAAPAGCSVQLQLFGFGRQADLELVELAAESKSGFAHFAAMKKTTV